MTPLADLCLERVLGIGANGTVWAARRRSDGELVAVKRLRAGASGPDHRREAALLAAVDHPGIVPILDAIDDGETLALVMPIADGGCLEQRLRRDAALPVDEAIGMVRLLADALAHAHRCGIIHRDVKPGNVLLRTDGGPWLADFGLAAWTHGDDPAATVTVGTAPYLDPAVIAGAPLTAAADQYALGVTAYRLLAGELPYTGPDPAAILAAAHTGDRVPLRTRRAEVPAGVAAAIDRALRLDPGERFPDMATFAAALADPTAMAAPPTVVLASLSPAAGTPDGRRRPGSDERLRSSDGVVVWTTTVCLLGLAAMLLLLDGPVVRTAIVAQTPAVLAALAAAWMVPRPSGRQPPAA